MSLIWLKSEVKSTSLNNNFTPNFTSKFRHIGLFMKNLDQKWNTIVFVYVSSDNIKGI